MDGYLLYSLIFVLSVGIPAENNKRKGDIPRVFTVRDILPHKADGGRRALIPLRHIIYHMYADLSYQRNPSDYYA